jgi:hypothetical protein
MSNESAFQAVTELLLSRLESVGASTALPDNQWQIDVEYWHSIVLAALQSIAVQSAADPFDPDWFQHLRGPSSPEARYLCQNQVREHLSIIIFIPRRPIS